MPDPDSETCIGIRDRYSKVSETEGRRSTEAYKLQTSGGGAFAPYPTIRCASCGIEYIAYVAHVHTPRECDRCTFHVKCYGF